MSLTFDLICIIIPFIPTLCHSPEVDPLQWQLLSSVVTSCLTSIRMSWINVVICSPFDDSHFLCRSSIAAEICPFLGLPGFTFFFHSPAASSSKIAHGVSACQKKQYEIEWGFLPFADMSSPPRNE